MKKFMLNEALSEFKGPFSQLLNHLSGEEGERWLSEFKIFLRKEKCWPEGPDSNSRHRPAIGPRSEALIKVLGITLISAMVCAFFFTLLWKQGGIEFFLGPTEVCFLTVSTISLLFTAAGVARFYGPTFRWRSWSWGEDFVAFGAIYLFFAPLMTGLFLAMVDQVAGLNIWCWQKTAVQFPIWQFLGFTSVTYITVLLVGYVWRLVRHDLGLVDWQ